MLGYSYSSPGFGGVRLPWLHDEVVEKVRHGVGEIDECILPPELFVRMSSMLYELC